MIIGNAILKHLKGKGNSFKVVNGFWYMSNDIIIKVLPGWVTDGASVPRIFWNIFPPVAGKYIEAAVLHDALYKTQPKNITRKYADRIFKDAMKSLNVAWWKRNIIYYAVRIGGWKAWRDNRKRGLIVACEVKIKNKEDKNEKGNNHNNNM